MELFTAKKLHPCCGYPSQLGAKFIAICDLVFGLIGIFWFIYILQSYGLLLNESNLEAQTTDIPPFSDQYQLQHYQYQVSTTPKFNDWFLSLRSQNNTAGNNESTVVYNKGKVFTVTNSGIEVYQETANVFLSGFYTVVNLCLSVLLLSASNEESVCMLITWFTIRLIIILFKAVIYIVYLVLGVPVSTQIPHIFFMFVHAYGLWIVWVFVKEIRAKRRISNLIKANNSAAAEGNSKIFGDQTGDDADNDAPYERPQKRKMTITIIEPDLVTIFEPYVGVGAGVEISGVDKPNNSIDGDKPRELKVVKSILCKPSASSPNSHQYRKSY